MAKVTKESDRPGTRINVRCTNELRDAIERLAKDARRTPSQWVIIALEDAVKAADAKKPPGDH